MKEFDPFAELTGSISAACAELFARWGQPQLEEAVQLERPALREHGDLALNIAMVAAKAVKRPPRELAGEVVDAIEASAGLESTIASAEIAGPGFINLYLSPGFLSEAALTALGLGHEFGRSSRAQPEKVLLEYVSANPTGPLHVGHARYAAYGDSLRRIMTFAGHDVTTEFYINDYGTQMELFGRSLAARYGELAGIDIPFPEEGYGGKYTTHIAELIRKEYGPAEVPSLTPELPAAAVDFFRVKGCELVLEEVHHVLERFRVRFDIWFSETTLYQDGKTDTTLDLLREKGTAFERDGALWLGTSALGDDKDRVLVRSTGEPTYFASDIAYHRDKLERGYEVLVNIWGADHHGYVPRMKAALAALAADPGTMEVIIGQLVNILERGERKQMSKRAGTMVTLTELLDSIGVDAARFFLVDRSHETTLDLDLEKAKLQSEENPVYYVQYAHARIASILRKAAEEGVEITDGGTRDGLEDEERDLILKLMEFPRVVTGAAATRSPHKITGFVRELAAIFHVFYHNCPVLRSDPETAAFRLNLCLLTRNVIATALGLVGVEAPERM